MQASCDSGASPEVRFQERERELWVGAGARRVPSTRPQFEVDERRGSGGGGGINRALFSVFPRAVRGMRVTRGLSVAAGRERERGSARPRFQCTTARLADAAGSDALRFLSFRGGGW